MVGPAGVVGWFRLLGRACQTEGVFPHPLSAELRDANLGIDSATAKAIATAMVEVGLVQEDEDGLRIAAWSTYQPPMRFLHSSNRGGVATQSQPTATQLHASATQPVAVRHAARDDERTNERTNKTNERTGSGHGLPSIGEILARGGSR